MNACCQVCKHHWWDKTKRREVAWIFASARSKLGATGEVLQMLDSLERECSKLAEVHICTVDGMEDCLEYGDECESWEAVA